MPIVRSLLLVGLLAGCRPPAYGSDLDPERWDDFGLGVSTGWEYFVHWRPREGAVPITYLYFVDHQCRLIPGEVRFEPWRKRRLPADLEPETVQRIEQHWAGQVEPAVEAIAPVRVPEQGAALELPVGTWQLDAWPTPADRPWPEDAEVRVFPWLTVVAESDAVIVMHHAVPPRARDSAAYDRRLGRRADRFSWRCFAGENLTPRFDARLADAERL